MGLKLKQILESIDDNESTQLTKEEKIQLVNQIKRFSSIGDQSIYNKQNIKETADTVRNIIERAKQMALSETGDWFDSVTVKRHMKQLDESYKTFEKTAVEMSQLQERLSAAFDDIGMSLSKYFDVD